MDHHQNEMESALDRLVALASVGEAETVAPTEADGLVGADAATEATTMVVPTIVPTVIDSEVKEQNSYKERMAEVDEVSDIWEEVKEETNDEADSDLAAVPVIKPTKKVKLEHSELPPLPPPRDPPAMAEFVPAASSRMAPPEPMRPPSNRFCFHVNGPNVFPSGIPGCIIANCKHTLQHPYPCANHVKHRMLYMQYI